MSVLTYNGEVHPLLSEVSQQFPARNGHEDVDLSASHQLCQSTVRFRRVT